MNVRESWILFALGSAFFAGLTALFGKIGVAGINSNLATFICTIVILGVTAAILSLRDEWRPTGPIQPKTWLFLVLSGIVTGFLVAVLLPRVATRARQQGRADRQAQRRVRDPARYSVRRRGVDLAGRDRRRTDRRGIDRDDRVLSLSKDQGERHF